MLKRNNKKSHGREVKRAYGNRQRNTAKFKLAKGQDINYKDFGLLQKYLNNRGKIIPKRVSGVSAKEQRELAQAIKIARYMALLITGGVKK